MNRETYIYNRFWTTESAPLHSQLLKYKLPNSNEVTYSNSQVWNTYSLKQLKGVDIPSYFARKRRGELLPMTPYEYMDYRETFEVEYDLYLNAPGGVQHWWCAANPQGINQRTFSDEKILSYWPASVNDAFYIQAAAAKIYGNSHDTLTFLAEFASLKRMFKQAITRLIRFEDTVNSLATFWKGKRTSAGWLEWRYGWRTFLLDLKSLEDAITTFKSKRTRFSEMAGIKYTFTNQGSETTPYTGWSRVKNYEEKVTVGVRGNVVADAYLPPLQFTTAITIWEMIPYSFVVDWLFRVGTWLSAMSLQCVELRHVASGGVLIDIHSVTSYTKTFQYVGSYGKYDGMNVVDIKFHCRQPSSISRFPQIKLSMDAFKVADLIALVAQRKRSKPPWQL